MSLGSRHQLEGDGWQGSKRNIASAKFYFASADLTIKPALPSPTIKRKPRVDADHKTHSKINSLSFELHREKICCYYFEISLIIPWQVGTVSLSKVN